MVAGLLDFGKSQSQVVALFVLKTHKVASSRCGSRESMEESLIFAQLAAPTHQERVEAIESLRGNIRRNGKLRFKVLGCSSAFLPRLHPCPVCSAGQHLIF
jgi:hypothetical protein